LRDKRLIFLKKQVLERLTAWVYSVIISIPSFAGKERACAQHRTASFGGAVRVMC